MRSPKIWAPGDLSSKPSPSNDTCINVPASDLEYLRNEVFLNTVESVCRTLSVFVEDYLVLQCDAKLKLELTFGYCDTTPNDDIWAYYILSANYGIRHWDYWCTAEGRVRTLWTFEGRNTGYSTVNIESSLERITTLIIADAYRTLLSQSKGHDS